MAKCKLKYRTTLPFCIFQIEYFKLNFATHMLPFLFTFRMFNTDKKLVIESFIQLTLLLKLFV